jgi:hypothetical protein
VEATQSRPICRESVRAHVQNQPGVSEAEHRGCPVSNDLAVEDTSRERVRSCTMRSLVRTKPVAGSGTSGDLSDGFAVSCTSLTSFVRYEDCSRGRAGKNGLRIGPRFAIGVILPGNAPSTIVPWTYSANAGNVTRGAARAGRLVAMRGSNHGVCADLRDRLTRDDVGL